MTFSKLSEIFDTREAYCIDLDAVQIFSEPRYRKSFSGLEWQPTQGGSSRISETDFNRIISAQISKSALHTIDTDDQTEFVLEKYLEEFIVSNWDKIDFGEKLRLFEDEDGNSGQQYYAEGVGYIDLLALDKNDDFVVTELKKGRKNDEVIGQVLRYMGWVRQKLAKKDQKVRGLIIVGEKDEKLEFALSEISDKVKVMRYSIKFKLQEYY